MVGRTHAGVEVDVKASGRQAKESCQLVSAICAFSYPSQNLIQREKTCLPSSASESNTLHCSDN